MVGAMMQKALIHGLANAGQYIVPLLLLLGCRKRGQALQIEKLVQQSSREVKEENIILRRQLKSTFEYENIVGAHPRMDGAVAHHPLFADFCALCFKLRFDQRNHPRTGRSKAHRHRQHFGERDKAGVTDDEVDRLWYLLLVKIAGIRALQNSNARIMAQDIGDLAAPDINGVNPYGTIF